HALPIGDARGALRLSDGQVWPQCLPDRIARLASLVQEVLPQRTGNRYPAIEAIAFSDKIFRHASRLLLRRLLRRMWRESKSEKCPCQAHLRWNRHFIEVRDEAEARCRGSEFWGAALQRRARYSLMRSNKV